MLSAGLGQGNHGADIALIAQVPDAEEAAGEDACREESRKVNKA
jgi:hypothetical protein